MPKRKAKPKAVVHSPETAKTGETEGEINESGENAALSTASTVAPVREARHPRPGQAVFNGLFDDALEAEILGHIANGCSWTAAAKLCGVSRDSVINWRNNGAAYLENPEENPQFERYGLFLQRIEEALAGCEAKLVKKLLDCDDWRSWRFWLINRGEDWKSEFKTETQVSGPHGAPLGQNTFSVNVMLSGDPNPTFSTVSHKEAATIDDPFAAPTTPDPRKSLHERRKQSAAKEAEPL